MNSWLQLEQLKDDIAVTKYLEMTVIEFLGTTTGKFLELNDISVTKFLQTALNSFLLDDTAVAELLAENDISVTKFLATSEPTGRFDVNQFFASGGPAMNLDSEDNGDISVTKFL